MTSMDWDEVKRLAADFQKAQLSSTLQKLSERNCIEIITKLVEDKLLDIIFTNDGKEYVTPQHLGKEIKDELYVHGGRINLVELAQILNVNLSQVSKVVSEIEKHNKGLKVILGQLIDKTYITKIAEEVNDKLEQNGYINVTELTFTYDLPAEFLQSVLEKELGRTIYGKQDVQDPRIFYTEGFIARNRAKIRGALSAITKPTSVSAILGQCSVPEKVFFSVVDNLQEMKQIPGIITGKQGGNSIYVPSIYYKSQAEWVDNFYKQNGYLEYDALARLGISDPPNFIKRHFPNNDIQLLDSVAAGNTIIDQVEANIEEAIATGSFIDIYPLLPSVFNYKDTEILLKAAGKKMKSNIHIFATTIAVPDVYLQDLSKSFEPLAEKKAKEVVSSGKWYQHLAETKIRTKSSDIISENKINKKEERRKKATSGKAGGGSQGRETKTKSTKKKYMQGKLQENDSDDQFEKSNLTKCELELVTMEDLKTQILKNDNIAIIEDFADELSSYLQPKMNKHALTKADELGQSSKSMKSAEIEERLNILITNIRIFDKGIKQVDKETQTVLAKYLLKSLATDFVSDIFKLAAQQNMIQCPENLTTEARQKMLLDLPEDVKDPLNVLHKSITGVSVEDFLNAIDAAMLACGLVMKKYDRKKEKPFVLNHREALLEELKNTEDPALALHLVTNILFTATTQCALHMSGRHVSSILSFLQTHLRQQTITTLAKYHDLVLKLLGNSNELEKLETSKALEEALVDMKAIAQNHKQQLITDENQV